MPFSSYISKDTLKKYYNFLDVGDLAAVFSLLLPAVLRSLSTRLKI